MKRKRQNDPRSEIKRRNDEETIVHFFEHITQIKSNTDAQKNNK